MKKKLLYGFAVLAIAAAAAFNMSVNSNSGLSDISLANVEALARSEGGNDLCDNACSGRWCYEIEIFGVTVVAYSCVGQV